MRGAEARPPEWDWIYALTDMKGPHKSMAELARQKNTHPVELMIDMALERDMKFFMIQPIANENQTEALELMKHPRSVVTFSDSGAHVSQIMDTSLQTHLLSHWVREKQAFTLEEAVKMITCDTATQFGFHDRGLLREGMAADIVVFDPDTVGAAHARGRHRPAGRRQAAAAEVPTACAPPSSTARSCCATTSRPATCRASCCARSGTSARSRIEGRHARLSPRRGRASARLSSVA